MMEVIPAIDLRGGRCVRLYQGDYSREEVFSSDPTAMALHWQELGAPRLHIVDLDGAAEGRLVNLGPIESIAAALHIPVQVGGGVRDKETASKLLNMGVQRVVLGTVALKSATALQEMLGSLNPEAVIVSVDSRDGLVAVQGWKEQSQVRALDLIKEMADLGVKRFIFTDIHRDGTLSGPNIKAIKGIISTISIALIASGGIASIEHLKALAGLGIEGAIVGKALYTGAIDLKKAIAILS